MPEVQPKGVTISSKNLAVWLTIAMIIVGSIVDSALTRSQVDRNTKELDTYNLSVIVTTQNNIAEDVTEMKGDVKALIKTFNDYALTHD